MKMTIDPGTNGTGFAIWNNEGILKEYGVINPPSKYTEWRERAEYVVSQLEIEIKFYSPSISSYYVEEPSFFQSTGGRVTASSGSLVKLSMLVGMIIDHFNAKTVKVNEWKGQLPKRVVENRVKKILGKEKSKNIKSHAFDAIGIGLYLQGRF
mgnify:CR=1 FL=1